MKKVMLLEEFLNEGLFDVLTSSKAFIKNPIAATKITNNGKKLAQAEIDMAASELDFEKRKLASSEAAKAKIENLRKKGDTEAIAKIKDSQRDNVDVIKAARDVKNNALSDRVSGINDRIEDLSKGNTALQDLASVVKTAARMKKNEVLIKGADDEERKQLKLKLKKDLEKINNLKKGFSDYESEKDTDNDSKKSSVEPPKQSNSSKSEPSNSSKEEPARPPKLPKIPNSVNEFKSFKEFFGEKS